MNAKLSKAALYMVPVLMFAGSAGFADPISEAFDRDRTVYSKEKADKAFFGTGEAGRMSEASALRFQGEQDLADRNIDEAIRKFGKALELDPGDPTGHVLYAKAITAKFYSKKDKVDEKLLVQCMSEWRLIFWHDADYLEQCEAKTALAPLNRIARALAKQKKELEKQQALAKAAKKNKELLADKSGAPPKKDSDKDSTTGSSDQTKPVTQVNIPLPKGMKDTPVNADPAITD